MRTEVIIPHCPFCEKLLDGPSINGLHWGCNQKLCEELADWEKKNELFGSAELARQ